jgi:hypothetical protein
MPAWVLLNLVPFLLLVILGVRFYRSAAPFWHLPRGNFEKARALFLWMTRSWFKTTRRTGVLGAAACDQFLGRYDDALTALRSLPYDDLDKAIGSTVADPVVDERRSQKAPRRATAAAGPRRRRSAAGLDRRRRYRQLAARPSSPLKRLTSPA